MSNRGWVKIDRALFTSNFWLSEEPFDVRSAWVDLIGLANHEDKDVMIGRQNLKIKRGQHFTSIVKLSRRWNWSRKRVYHYLGMLEGASMVTRKVTHNGTLLTIVNYGKYQDMVSTKVTPTVTPKVTTEVTPRVTQTRMNKNELRSKEEKKNAPLTNAFGYEVEE